MKILLPATLLLAALAANLDLGSPEVTPAVSSIRPEAIRAHVRYLADDLLEGRGTATRGHELAAKYIAAQFESIGLEPGGEGGSFLQPVPFVQSELDFDRSEAAIIKDGREMKLQFGREYFMIGDLFRATTSVEAPVVFVGHGVSAPESGWDDYRGVDVRGKIVAYVGGGPGKLAAPLRAIVGENAEKERQAVAHGAIGVIRIFRESESAIIPWDRAVSQNRAPAIAWLEAGEKPHRRFAELRGSMTLRESAFAQLFAAAGKSAAEAIAAARKKPSSMELPARVRISKASRVSKVFSPNVVGVLRGSDPKLRDEYVVYSAHADHLGISTPVRGDSIYNGALDDASGTSGIIEIARAFASMPARPARSLLFLAVTGEERGLLGSDYFANNPTVPIDAIAANINLDGLPANASLDVVPLGAEHSSLMDVVKRNAAAMQYEVSPDPSPEQVFFVRSDQYNFVKKGVPAVFLIAGEKSGDPNVDLEAINKQWRETRYHSPFDDLSQPLNWEAMARFARLAFAVGLDVANAPSRPKWNKGSFFGERFGTPPTK